MTNRQVVLLQPEQLEARLLDRRAPRKPHPNCRWSSRVAVNNLGDKLS
jgi:hypothetical protein